MKKKYSVMQYIFIPLMLLFFLCMNIGFVKYNPITTVVSILALTLVSLVGIWRWKSLLHSPMTRKAYRWALFVIFVVSFIVQTFVCFYVPLEYYSDFIIVREQAIHMADDYAILPGYDFYFHSYPYQLNIVFIINFLYGIFGSYKGVEIFTTALVNLSAIIAALTVCNITHNRRVAVIVAIMFEVFSTFCLKTYMPYTANIGMLFPVLMLLVYTMDIERKKKLILLALVVAIAYRVKMTTIIPFIAMVLFEGYRLIKEKEFKSIVLGTVSLIFFSAILMGVHKIMTDKMNFTNDEKINHGFVYYLAMGQNNPTGGQYNLDIGVMGNQQFPSKEARNKYFLDMAMQYVKERNAISHVKFFVSKIAYCWGETRLDHLNFCKYDEAFLIFKHYTWYLSLLLMVAGTFMIINRRYFMLLLGIWGVIVYLYLSEAGARYVLMYMPLVYVMAGWTVVEWTKRKMMSDLKPEFSSFRE